MKALFGGTPSVPAPPSQAQLEADQAKKRERDVQGLRNAILARQERVGRDQLKTNPGLYIP